MFRRTSGKPPSSSPRKGGGGGVNSNPYAAAQTRYSTLSPQLNWNAELERWVRTQPGRDARGAFGSRLVQTGNYGSLICDARLAGEALRTLANGLLYADSGAQWTPLANEPVPFSPEALVKASLRAMGIPRENVVFTDSNSGLDLRRKEYSASIRHEIHAWLFAQPDGRHPAVFVNLASPPMPIELETVTHEWEIHHTPVWAVHLALCLFSLYDHYATHVGYAVPGGQAILPPFSENESDVVPVAHMFVKGLFGMTNDCPRISPCPCNEVLQKLRRLPQRHREMTGELRTAPPAHGGPRLSPRPAAPSRPLSSRRITSTPPYTPTPPASPAVPPDWLQRLQNSDREAAQGGGEDDEHD